MSLDYVGDFEEIVPITEEDHISAKCVASYVRSELVSRTPDSAGQCREVATFLTQDLDKPPRDFEVAAFSSDMFKKTDQVCLG